MIIYIYIVIEMAVFAECFPSQNHGLSMTAGAEEALPITIDVGK